MSGIFKFQIAFSSLFITILVSCNQSDQTNNRMTIASKIDNYKTGDCFEFKEKIREFGVVFIKENKYNDDQQFNFIPVKLDTTKTGIDKFKHGKVYLSSFTDYTRSDGKTQGFMVYFFLHQENFNFINTLFTYSGSISIKGKYRNSTGGTSASNYEEFKYQLNRWNQMFGHNGRLILVSDILK